MLNDKQSCVWMGKKDIASPTAPNESIILIAEIDAKEGRYVMGIDAPNTFFQTEIIMKYTGALVDMLLKMDPDMFKGYVVYENGRKSVYLVILRAIRGMLVASLLWYHKFNKDLKSIVFVFNIYDPCVENSTVNEKQHTFNFMLTIYCQVTSITRLTTNF